MRRDCIVCDFCGREVEKYDSRIKVKFRKRDEPWNDEFEFAKWKKLDVCMICAGVMREYIKERINDST